ncbi:MAG: FAD-dependent oxidoreductase, partial [Nitrospiraceae bacterium]|nr:FAD-dependent oxidoreductase [Nitrospiraceae bacterium]
YWLNQLEKDEKIEVIYNANVVEVYGDKFVQGLKLDNGQDLKVDGMFVEIGSVPSTSLANEIGVKTDDYGYILVNEAMETNIKGVYAAGDVSHSMNQLKQVVTAVAGGAIAAESAYKALKKDK